MRKEIEEFLLIADNEQIRKLFEILNLCEPSQTCIAKSFLLTKGSA